MCSIWEMTVKWELFCNRYENEPGFFDRSSSWFLQYLEVSGSRFHPNSPLHDSKPFYFGIILKTDVFKYMIEGNELRNKLWIIYLVLPTFPPPQYNKNTMYQPFRAAISPSTVEGIEKLIKQVRRTLFSPFVFPSTVRMNC